MRFLLTIGLISLSMSPVCADRPRWAHHFNQVGRVVGVGWSDGYHACRNESRPFGADLPPAPAWLQQRWAHPHAWQVTAGPQHTAAPTVVEPHHLPRPQNVQQPATPSQPPVPPSILEEIRQYEREFEPIDLSESLDEQAEYETFLRAVRQTRGHSTQSEGFRFIREPVHVREAETDLPSLPFAGPASAKKSSGRAQALRCVELAAPDSD